MSSLLVVASVPVVLVLVFGPGLLTGRLLGLRGLALWGLAPAVSCALLGLGGALAQVLGLRWSPGVFAGLTVLAAALAGLVGRSLPGPSRPRDPVGSRWGARVGGLLGALTVVAGFAASMGSLRQVPAQPDATYHLNAIRSMLQTGDISSRDGGAFLYGRAHSFYPSTFHGLAATAGQVVHAQPVVLANVLAVVSGVVVWVLGCLLLCRQVFGDRPRTLVFGGLAAGSFTAAPYWVGGYGPLWPYLLGLALVPGLLGCLLSLLRLAEQDAIGPARAAVVGVVGAGGLGLVHPQAVSALVLVAYTMLVVAVVGLAGRHRTVGSSVLAVVGLAGPLALWWAASQTAQITAMSVTYRLGPEDSLGRATYAALVNDSRPGHPLFVTSALVVVGVVGCLLHFRTRWVALAWVVLVAALVAVAGIQSPATRALTVYWYNGIPRLAALVPLAAVPALAAGLATTSGWVSRLVLLRISSRVSRLTAHAATAAVGALFLVLTLGNNQGAHVANLEPFYQPRSPGTALLSQAQAAALQRLARSIPAGAVVADNPWRGHALLYAFTGRRVLFASEKAATTPDRTLVADQLAEAGAPGRSDVCAAIRRLGVSYVLTGGTNDLGHHNGRSDFAGVDAVPGRPGFTPVATAAPYTLWRITACSP